MPFENAFLNFLVLLLKITHVVTHLFKFLLFIISVTPSLAMLFKADLSLVSSEKTDTSPL